MLQPSTTRKCWPSACTRSLLAPLRCASSNQHGFPIRVAKPSEPQRATEFSRRTARYNPHLPSRIFVSAIIAAGGRGERFGAATPKQLLTVGDRTILERSVTAFLAHPAIGEVIVALPADL